jgi:hypothetical protein
MASIYSLLAYLAALAVLIFSVIIGREYGDDTIMILHVLGGLIGGIFTWAAISMTVELIRITICISSDLNEIKQILRHQLGQ